MHHEQAHGIALAIAGGPVQRRVALSICYADILHQARSFNCQLRMVERGTRRLLSGNLHILSHASQAGDQAHTQVH